MVKSANYTKWYLSQNYYKQIPKPPIVLVMR